jgi:hypothetical protein
MPNEVLRKTDTPQICFADHADDFAPAAGTSLEQGTPTDVEWEFASVIDDAARQSNQVDLGATRAPAFSVMAALEFAATPTAGQTVEFYWAPSPDSVAANGNPGGVSGSDSAYTGYSSNLDASLKQLDFIGAFIVTAQATTTVQVGIVGVLIPSERYGTLVAVNRSAASIHSDDVEIHVVFNPLVDEIQ